MLLLLLLLGLLLTACATASDSGTASEKTTAAKPTVSMRDAVAAEPAEPANDVVLPTALPTVTPPATATSAPAPIAGVPGSLDSAATERQPIADATEGQAVVEPAIPPTDAPLAAAPTVAPAAPTVVPVAPTATTAPLAVAPPTPPAAPTSAPPEAPAVAQAPPAARSASEILFVRGGTLTAYRVDNGQERVLFDGVQSFAPSRDGSRIAAVRQNDIWLINRDGSNARQLTATVANEHDLMWTPDGTALAYSAATAAPPVQPSWNDWSVWCSQSTVHVYDVASAQDTVLGAGCDPAFSPDGKRVAYATPPQQVAISSGPVNQGNTITLVNRQGENGWTFARAGEGSQGNGYVVFAPTFAPSGDEVAYQRFIGYMAAVDISFTEFANSFDGEGAILHDGAGWLLPPAYSPDGQRIAVVQHNYSDARGWDGYEVWQLRVIQPNTAGEIILPTGTLPTAGRVVDSLPNVTAAAWSPTGVQLAVAMPAGWQDSGGALPTAQRYGHTDPATLWLWQPGNAPAPLNVTGIDFASPLAWLP